MSADRVGDATFQAWRSEAERALRGKRLESLVRRDEDGLAIEPLYATTSSETSLERRRNVGAWLVGQAYFRPGVEAAAKEIAVDAASGVEAYFIVLDRAARLGLSPADPRAHELVGRGGIAAGSGADIDALLTSLPLRSAPVLVDGGANGAIVAAFVASHCVRVGIDGQSVAFSASIDPLGALASDGRLPRSVATVLEEAHWVKGAFPRGMPLLASGIPYHEAGATPALELGATLATLVEYVRAALPSDTDGKPSAFTIDDVLLAVAADANVVTAVAKVRALRLLVAKAAQALELPSPKPFVLGVTSHRHLTKRDAETNIVRGTTETFALAVGGADAIVTRAYDRPIGGIDAQARRTAKNTQLVLRDEAAIGNVGDPLRGSFAIEARTEALAEAGWNAMRAIEADGGMRASLESGAMQARIARANEARQRDLGRRARSIIGITDFAPSKHNTKSDWPDRDRERENERNRHATKSGVPDAAPIESWEALVTAAKPDASVAFVSSGRRSHTAPETADRLDRVRDGERFEALRAEADRLGEVRGARPSVVIIRAGTVEEARPRVEFVTRLFEVGGFHVATVDANAIDSTKGAPDVVVLASTDAVYESKGGDLLSSIRRAFPEALLVLAGRKGNLAEALASVAPSKDVFAGTDVVAFLADVLHSIRVRREGGSS